MPSKITAEEIKELSLKFEDKLIELRRDFHMHPEVGFKEVRTNKVITEELTKLGYCSINSKIAKTGVTCLLKEDNAENNAKVALMPCLCRK
jgi:metal-dependent amidase/aminoacylase/carboxypeptidase family protein